MAQQLCTVCQTKPAKYTHKLTGNKFCKCCSILYLLYTPFIADVMDKTDESREK